MIAKSVDTFVDIGEACRALGISRSTIFRLIRRGSIQSIRRGGRRLIPQQALMAKGARRAARSVPPLTRDHPIFRLVGAGRGGGKAPGARDKHAILDQ
jgi:excisionase family DNA binding protein